MATKLHNEGGGLSEAEEVIGRQNRMRAMVEVGFLVLSDESWVSDAERPTGRQC